MNQCSAQIRAFPVTAPVPHRERRFLTALCLWLTASLGLATAGAATDATSDRTVSGQQDFTQLSLEELASIEVTTVSKKAEKLSTVPAAVTVITADEIRRSGVQTLPDALRLAPGTQVARVDASHWAVSIRGFNDTFAQKLLVLIDGRSVYTPLFSGTMWQAQDVILEDLSRIEVVRGPGGSVWGANAVNGVVNIVTKSARETQGLLLTGGGGSQHQGLAGVRYGVQLGENTFLRLYGKYDDWDNSRQTTGAPADDAWWKAQGGFRLDWEPTEADRFTLQGDLVGLDGDLSVPQVSLTPPYNSATVMSGGLRDGNVLGRWTHQFSEDSELAVQSYYEYSHVDHPLVAEKRDTGDFDVRHRLRLGEVHDFVWGGGYRVNQSEFRGSPEFTFSRAARADQVANFFVQDELTLVPERLHLTLGSKVEKNDYTGLEYEPSARLAWTPDARQTVWASVARAVRTPSQIERDAHINLAVVPPIPPAPATLISVQGNSGFDREELIATELGYRVQAHPRWIVDVAGFVNCYDELRGPNWQLDASQLPAYAQMVSIVDNGARGTTYGTELSTTWQATDWWRLQALFTFLGADLHVPLNTVTGQPAQSGFASPRYQASLRSGFDLGRHVEFDAWVRFVDEVQGAGAPQPGVPADSGTIPSYVTFDLRLAWRPKSSVEFSLVGQNLAGPHLEFAPTFVSTQRIEVPRSVFVQLSLRF
jgi:iron complex outermembrane receptor protein